MHTICTLVLLRSFRQPHLLVQVYDVIYPVWNSLVWSSQSLSSPACSNTPTPHPWHTGVRFVCAVQWSASLSLSILLYNVHTYFHCSLSHCFRVVHVAVPSVPPCRPSWHSWLTVCVISSALSRSIDRWHSALHWGPRKVSVWARCTDLCPRSALCQKHLSLLLCVCVCVCVCLCV